MLIHCNRVVFVILSDRLDFFSDLRINPPYVSMKNGGRAMGNQSMARKVDEQLMLELEYIDGNVGNKAFCCLYRAEVSFGSFGH
jgi:hypothetical protein